MIKVKIIRDNNELLDEAKEDKVREKYVEKGVGGKFLRPSRFSRIVRWVNTDRKNRLKYIDFLAKVNSGSKIPNWGDIVKPIEYFEKNKNSLSGDERNIDSYENLRQILDVVKSIKNKKINRGRANFLKRLKKASPTNEKGFYTDVDVVYDKGTIVVTRPHTAEASCTIGKGTAWCISAREADPESENYGKPTPFFDDYTGDEKIFYFIEDFSKGKKDKHRMVAVQMSADYNDYKYGNPSFNYDGDVGFDGYWDYYDNPTEKVPLDIYNLNKVYPDDQWDEVLKAIDDHAQWFPPEENTKLRDLNAVSDKINRGEYDSKYLKFNSTADQINNYLIVQYAIKFFVDTKWAKQDNPKDTRRIIYNVIRDANEELSLMFNNYLSEKLKVDFKTKDDVEVYNEMTGFEISRFAKDDNDNTLRFSDVAEFSQWHSNINIKLDEKKIEQIVSTIEEMLPAYDSFIRKPEMNERKKIYKIKII